MLRILLHSTQCSPHVAGFEFEFRPSLAGFHSPLTLKQCGLEYDKADKTIYAKVKDRQETAFKYARKLERHWNEMGVKFPARENPSTSVHKLVEFLNELADLDSVD